MVPGDIYIGKETLIEYRVVPHDSEFGIDSYMEHFECGNEVDTDSEDLHMTPWDYLNAVLAHEKECPKKCPKPVSPAEDSSMTSAEMEEIKDAAVATGRYREIQPSRSKENPYAKIEENGGSLTMTVVPKNNVL